MRRVTSGRAVEEVGSGRRRVTCGDGLRVHRFTPGLPEGVWVPGSVRREKVLVAGRGGGDGSVVEVIGSSFRL